MSRQATPKVKKFSEKQVDRVAKAAKEDGDGPKGTGLSYERAILFKHNTPPKGCAFHLVSLPDILNKETAKVLSRAKWTAQFKDIRFATDQGGISFFMKLDKRLPKKNAEAICHAFNASFRAMRKDSTKDKWASFLPCHPSAVKSVLYQVAPRSDVRYSREGNTATQQKYSDEEKSKRIVTPPADFDEIERIKHFKGFPDNIYMAGFNVLIPGKYGVPLDSMEDFDEPTTKPSSSLAQKGSLGKGENVKRATLKKQDSTPLPKKQPSLKVANPPGVKQPSDGPQNRISKSFSLPSTNEELFFNEVTATSTQKLVEKSQVFITKPNSTIQQVKHPRGVKGKCNHPKKTITHPARRSKDSGRSSPQRDMTGNCLDAMRHIESWPKSKTKFLGKLLVRFLRKQEKEKEIVREELREFRKLIITLFGQFGHMNVANTVSKEASFLPFTGTRKLDECFDATREGKKSRLEALTWMCEQRKSSKYSNYIASTLTTLFTKRYLVLHHWAAPGTKNVMTGSRPLPEYFKNWYVKCYADIAKADNMPPFDRVAFTKAVGRFLANLRSRHTTQVGLTLEEFAEITLDTRDDQYFQGNDFKRDVLQFLADNKPSKLKLAQEFFARRRNATDNSTKKRSRSPTPNNTSSVPAQPLKKSRREDLPQPSQASSYSSDKGVTAKNSAIPRKAKSSNNDIHHQNSKNQPGQEASTSPQYRDVSDRESTSSEKTASEAGDVSPDASSADENDENDDNDGDSASASHREDNSGTSSDEDDYNSNDSDSEHQDNDTVIEGKGKDDLQDDYDCENGSEGDEDSDNGSEGKDDSDKHSEGNEDSSNSKEFGDDNSKNGNNSDDSGGRGSRDSDWLLEEGNTGNETDD